MACHLRVTLMFMCVEICYSIRLWWKISLNLFTCKTQQNLLHTLYLILFSENNSYRPKKRSGCCKSQAIMYTFDGNETSKSFEICDLNLPFFRLWHWTNSMHEMEYACINHLLNRLFTNFRNRNVQMPLEIHLRLWLLFSNTLGVPE